MIDSNPSLVILDVRNQSEYHSGHIRNAKLIPAYELEARLDELNINDKILVYCLSGGRSSRASNILGDNGFLHVYNMLGGITAWINEGYSAYVKYSSIQEAVDNATEGDAIFVSSGFYYEHLTVNKSLTLVGENRDTTVIDGTINGTVVHVKANNVSITGFTLRNSSFCVCQGYAGVYVEDVQNVKIIDNIIGHHGYGIKLGLSRNAIVIRNNITNNVQALDFGSSFGGIVYHNNFVNNINQVSGETLLNTWDAGYPSGGNYWSDYNGIDLNHDGLGNDSYVINDRNQDMYPLIAPINVFYAGIWNGISYSVDVVSNSAVSSFYFNPDEGAFLRFNVTGEGGTSGFCRVAIPKDLLWAEDRWIVYVGAQQLTPTLIPDQDKVYLYFTYSHSTKTVEIQGIYAIPEFPSSFVLPLFMLATLLAVLVYIRKNQCNPCQSHMKRHVS